MTISSMKMLDAELAFATANTPLYLLRKLRQSPTVARIAATKSAFQIYRSLASALKRKPKNFRDSVLPYALLVALSMRSDNKYLSAVAELPSPYHHWFKYSCDSIVGASRSTTKEIVGFKGKLKIQRSTKTGNRTNVVRLAGNP
jgi:hypothetical protein